MTVRISTKDAPRYTFYVDDAEYSMPAMGSLPIPFLRKYAREGAGEDIGIDLILDLLGTQAVRTDTGERAEGLADLLGAEAVTAIFADYSRTSGEDLGESSASSGLT